MDTLLKYREELSRTVQSLETEKAVLTQGTPGLKADYDMLVCALSCMAGFLIFCSIQSTLRALAKKKTQNADRIRLMARIRHELAFSSRTGGLRVLYLAGFLSVGLLSLFWAPLGRLVVGDSLRLQNSTGFPWGSLWLAPLKLVFGLTLSVSPAMHTEVIWICVHCMASIGFAFALRLYTELQRQSCHSRENSLVTQVLAEIILFKVHLTKVFHTTDDTTGKKLKSISQESKNTISHKIGRLHGRRSSSV